MSREEAEASVAKLQATVAGARRTIRRAILSATVAIAACTLTDIAAQLAMAAAHRPTNPWLNAFEYGALGTLGLLACWGWTRELRAWTGAMDRQCVDAMQQLAMIEWIKQARPVIDHIHAAHRAGAAAVFAPENPVQEPPTFN